MKDINLDDCATTSLKHWIENADMRHLYALLEAVSNKIMIRQQEAHDQQEQDDDSNLETEAG